MKDDREFFLISLTLIMFAYCIWVLWKVYV